MTIWMVFMPRSPVFLVEKVMPENPKTTFNFLGRHGNLDAFHAPLPSISRGEGNSCKTKDDF
jgi:hypothetical protein